MRILVTGGAGFIGSALCRRLVLQSGHEVVNLDKLTYAANLASLDLIRDSDRAHLHHFVHGDIADVPLVTSLLQKHEIDAVIHLAAESHVDRSIDGPSVFIETNVLGTSKLLGAVTSYWNGLAVSRKANFRFLHVSTDEVFGDLPFDASLFNETTPYAPSSPYSASKAASDHLVRAWHETYGLPTIISNCSNNYGPFHFPEKLIPLVILNALEGKKLPVYGTGANVRDWLFVEDHARALELIVSKGRPGETYLIGGNSERTNLEVVQKICDLLDEYVPNTEGSTRRALISFVTDRPGHDRRYAIDASKIRAELGWSPSMTFDDGLRQTVRWFLENELWWRPIGEGTYRGDRLGKTGAAH